MVLAQSSILARIVSPEYAVVVRSLQRQNLVSWQTWSKSWDPSDVIAIYAGRLGMARVTE